MIRRKLPLVVLMEPLHLEGCHLDYVMVMPPFKVYDVYFLRFGEEAMEIFMDDFSIYGSSFENYLKSLEIVLQR